MCAIFGAFDGRTQLAEASIRRESILLAKRWSTRFISLEDVQNLRVGGAVREALRSPPFGFCLAKKNASVHADPWSSGNVWSNSFWWREMS